MRMTASDLTVAYEQTAAEVSLLLKINGDGFRKPALNPKQSE